MGTVKIDLSKRQIAYENEFNLGTPAGVLSLLRKLHKIRARRDQGDIEASVLLMDFYQAWSTAPLTPKERYVLFYLYERSLKKKETARIMGISVQAVRKHERKAARKIAAMMGGYNG
jgi:DNA-directed RNA polymerase specialized sigma24 family protein